MPLIEVPIPNMIGGVSQQPPAGRVPGQLEACDNALLHPVNGLSKRRPTEHVARLGTGSTSVIATHLINRDAAERYLVLLGERRLRVFSVFDGTEYPVMVDGTSTAVGRGKVGSGKPLAYLDPRVPGGIVDQDEDFVIGAGDWLTVAANSVTSYVAGMGPLGFGRRESTASVTTDTVAEVGNAAAATVSDIYQDFGVMAGAQALSVYAKKSSSALTDFELTLSDTALTDKVTARFDVDAQGVITAGPVVSTGPESLSEVEDVGGGWYRCTLRTTGGASDFPAPGFWLEGETRRIRIRFHTVGVSPANKRLLLFGCRCYQLERVTSPVPDYIYSTTDLFRALTVADSTFLLNTEVTTAMGATVSATPSPLRGFVFVREGGVPDVQYKVRIRYLLATVPTTKTFTFATATVASGTENFQTDEDIAEGLRAAIDADADLVATRQGSVIRIVTAASTPGNTILEIQCSDSRGDVSMTAISTYSAPHGSGQSFITRFTDLPLILDSDWVVQVTGDPERGADDYYVKFKSQESGNLVAGHWEESVRPGIANTVTGIKTQFDASTMPQQLTRRQDDAAGTITGTPNAIYFDVSAVDWDDRLVGDEISNPEPSFIGWPIRDLFLYRGRLGFLSEENVILSEVGEILNFWRTTVLELPDVDPIDVNAGIRDTVLFRNAVPVGDTLLLFSDRHQFQLTGEPSLTPATAQLLPSRTFASIGRARPVDSGRGTILARPSGSFSLLMEGLLLGDAVSFRFDDLTLTAPRYIAGEVVQMAHSNLSGVLVARTDDEASVLYIHQSFWDDQETRLQSAIHRWVLDPDAQVRGIGVIDTDLYLISERAQGWFLERMSLSIETVEGGQPVVHLDRRVDSSQVILTYDGGLDQTTITMPYNLSPTATYQVVDMDGVVQVPVLSTSSPDIVVAGDLSAADLRIGERYDMRATLSEPVVLDQAAGALIPRMARPLDVHRLALYVADTALVRVEVSRDLRGTTAEEVTAAQLGTGMLLLGELGLFTGDAVFAILGRSTEIDVTIVNRTPFPCRVQAGRWEILTRARAGLV